MDPYIYGVTKLHELREERLATLTVTCIPSPLHLAQRGMRRLWKTLSGPACHRSC